MLEIVSTIQINNISTEQAVVVMEESGCANQALRVRIEVWIKGINIHDCGIVLTEQNYAFSNKDKRASVIFRVDSRNISS